MAAILPLEGVVQSYDWGGTRYLAELLDIPNPERKPMAEWWLGTHAKGTAQLKEQGVSLTRYIADQPVKSLGKRVAQRFGNELPFLLKVLDVQDMLSIQVHPDKAAAEAGFAREETHGPPRSASDRNYRDDNHKPELGVALTDFYLLHGFRSETAIRKTLSEVPGWDTLLPVLETGGTEALYRHVMSAEQDHIDALLHPLVTHVTRNKRMYHREEPGFWVRRAAEIYSNGGHHDRGIFSIYWFNIVHLRPGQGIFQDAGIPHAYLEGACVELMANSDNVLRGGLTPKHIDVPELLEKTDCSAVSPKPLTAADLGNGWHRYPTPAPDFSLSVARPESGSHLSVNTERGPGILLLLEGAVTDEKGQTLSAGQLRAAFLPADETYTLVAKDDSVLYLAEVGHP